MMRPALQIMANSPSCARLDGRGALLLAARLISGVVLASAAIVLVAWITGFDPALSLLPGLPAMKFNTALSLLLLALCLEARTGTDLGGSAFGIRRSIAAALLCGAGLIGLLSAIEMLFGVSIGIDELFVSDRLGRTASGAVNPGRMAPATVVSILMLVVALGCRWWAPRAGARRIACACALGAASMGLAAGAALIVSAEGLTEIEFFSTMALHTAWLIALLGVGVVLAEVATAHGAGATRVEPGRRRAELRLAVAAAGTLTAGLAITVAVARRTLERDREAARARFDRLTDRLIREAKRRLELPVYGLKGARGVYAASNSVERLEFRRYVSSRDLPSEFPGALGFGFIQRVPRSGLDAFIAAERADNAPDFKVKIPWHDVAPPERPSASVFLPDDLFIIRFIDPLQANEPAWGYDAGSDAVRRSAIERAIRSGEPTLTGRISLLQDRANRAGFLFLVPVYRNGAPVATEADRVESAEGLVYAPLVADLIFAGVELAAEGNLDFEVFEGEETTLEALLFDLDGHLAGKPGQISAEQYRGRMFETRAPLHVGGRVWTIRASTTPAFDAGARTTQPLLATMAGLVLSTLAAGFVWTLGHSSVRAEELARAMTADLRRATSELERNARTDRLTGLPNRSLLLDRVGQAMRRFQRRPDRWYAVLFLDFDRFKFVNDTLGHDAGDQLLVQIAGRLRGELRPSDSIAIVTEGHTAARMGGDEFVVLLEDLSAPGDATSVAARLVDVFLGPYQIAGQSVVSTASIGVVIGDSRYADPSEVLRDADVAMYEAKAAGKGLYVVFDAAMRARLLRRVELERGLRTAAQLGQLALHYQPIVTLETGKVRHVEAFLRWTHPVLGDISPAEFVHVAEDSGQVAALMEWVVREASAQAAGWRRTFGPADAPIVAVNLSRKQLAVPDLAERLTEIVRGSGSDPRQMCLEITESAVMRDHGRAVALLKDLRKSGFAIALDDFGTGQSSLASLHTLPLNAVKLDRAFIAQSGQGRAHAAMVQAIVSLASNLGMMVIAEGVETTEQLAMLQTLDCHQAQGYLFGKPVPAPDLRLSDTHERRAA